MIYIENPMEARIPFYQHRGARLAAEADTGGFLSLLLIDKRGRSNYYFTSYAISNHSAFL